MRRGIGLGLVGIALATLLGGQKGIENRQAFPEGVRFSTNFSSWNYDTGWPQTHPKFDEGYIVSVWMGLANFPEGRNAQLECRAGIRLVKERVFARCELSLFDRENPDPFDYGTKEEIGLEIRY